MLTKEHEKEIRARLNTLDDLSPCVKGHRDSSFGGYTVRFDCRAAREVASCSIQDVPTLLAALDSERQTVAKLRYRIEKLREATITLADISFEQSPWGRLMRDAITEDDRFAKEQQ